MKKILFSITAICTLTLMLGSCYKKSDDLLQPNADAAIADAMKSTEGVDGRVVFTQVVQLEGRQEVPAVSTETKGIAILRVTEDKKLYSKVIIQKLASGDALRFAHVHAGALGANGPVRIALADNAADFGVNKVLQLTDAQFTFITTGAAYVNAHSNFFPSGIVRGQIR